MDKNKIGCVVSAYTGILCVDFPSFHEYVEKIMGRGVMTHELGTERITNEIRERSHSDFLELCKWCSKKETNNG